MDIFNRSIEVILQNQDEGGAYIACPDFPNYHYCWLRDGSFIAHAMDQVERFASAEKFFRWVGSTIMRYAAKVDVLAEQLRSGIVPDHRAILNTRFTLEGLEEGGENTWGNFQIDGYGTWLWALKEHVIRSGNTSLLHELSAPIELTLRYLELTWQLPNYDCWEEHPEYLHPYSLAAVYAGFTAVADLVRSGLMNAGSVDAARLAVQVKEFIDKFAVLDGRLVKHIQPGKAHRAARPIEKSGVDSSLIALAIPYAVLPLDHPLMQTTLRAIESDLLRPQGGVYRYKADVYYGGGEWILLSAFLGMAYVQSGTIQKADSLKKWIEAQAEPNGDLPEQVSDFLLAPADFERWKNDWGPVASPLLWSHAMYILLVKSIEDAKTQSTK